MNNSLLARVCQEMRQRNTQELLSIWVENDHDLWSEEALEAARTILVERGVAVPSQKEPVKGVPEARPAVDEEWMRWMKALLMLAIIVGLAGEMTAITMVVSVAQNITAGVASGELRLVAGVVASYGPEIGLPLLLLAGAWGCWNRKPAGRIAMIAYSWAIVAFGVRYVLQGVYLVFVRGTSFRREIRDMEGIVYWMVLPAVLLFFMTRAPIKELFGVGKRGFAVEAGGHRQAEEPAHAGEGAPRG